MTSTSRPGKRFLPHLLSVLLLAGVAAAAWAGWLGWDQERDVHPDGSSTGPYEAWQVIGLVLTLLAAVLRAALRRHYAGAVFGTAAGLAGAAWYDWSDDSSGLFAVGVFMITVTTLGVTALVCFATDAVRRRNARRTGA
ncbi:hypothetical protein [Streptomyces sp. MJP52]|uniref:hypothetical protein n=1 Tax=Streptomyces sp. MJP52 TaxID=2940555 RepID=UPI00247310F6|nr:hypothetical protein [Streptomyces sp. MJP52]MDH6226466.1 cellulase/cellobiase CelA1 [Streptomyces sp. MJP52]